ncbi:MAG: LPS export ABC transporter ATP-binding protein [Alphaproteobacteria bacterium GM7ARS4]|nr:LPS export ABC transporter ATP-binding protein [Alphaproteobacteria bacterium GM7ARS4]
MSSPQKRKTRRLKVVKGRHATTFLPRKKTSAQGTLRVANLGKMIGKKRVLQDISMTLHRGEAVGLLGPNGAGKTTIFHIIVGLIGTDYGSILIDGEDVTLLPMHVRSQYGIGYLPQESSVFRGLSVEENILAVLEIGEPDIEYRRSMLDDLLAEFSISHLRRANVMVLSGGERRRLEIARCLAARPRYVLLDEPLAGIDPIAVNEIRHLISHLKDRGIGVLVTDHNVRDTLRIIDRAYVLHDGGVIIEGTPKDIVASEAVREVYLGKQFNL